VVVEMLSKKVTMYASGTGKSLGCYVVSIDCYRRFGGSMLLRNVCRYLPIDTA